MMKFGKRAGLAETMCRSCISARSASNAASLSVLLVIGLSAASLPTSCCSVRVSGSAESGLPLT
jgi:hypothetical protein